MDNNNSNTGDNIQVDPIRYFKQSMNINIHHFYINGVISEDIRIYAELINALKTCQENDTIIININSLGGDLCNSIQIVNAIRSAACHVITSLEAQACSAATLIFLAGHEYIIHPNCAFMIHNYSAGLWGKGHEVEARLEHLKKWSADIQKTYYSMILTEKELMDVMDGKDLWLTSEDLMERLKDNIKDCEIEELALKRATKDRPKKESTEKKKTTKKKTKKKKKVGVKNET